MRHAFPDRRRRSLLAFLRSPFVGWLQVNTALLWILLPAPVVNSYWHDTDYDGIPEFYSDPPSPWETEDADSDGLTNGEESTFGSSPFLQDSDNDGLSDVQEYTISQALGSNLNPWHWDTDGDGINDYWDNDPLIPLDSDGDGIPDYYDSFPNDPTNDTSYWSGGQFWIDAIFASIGTTAYSTSAGPQDSDNDGIIDAADPYDYDPSNNTAWWNGGTFRINAVEQTFGYTPYTTSSGTYDSDNDGIPDGLDPYAGDSNNNSYWWNGGNFLLNGDSLHFFSGAWTTPGDTDNDGIPDGADPYPNDSNNNSIWYDTLYYWSDGYYGFLGSGWYSASSGNADGDSLPDALDPYPNDPTNNTSWWYGGTYWIDGALTMIHPTDPFAWATSGGMYDNDGDGIYDSADPYLDNAANNTAFWQGGTFWIDGYQQSFSADVYGYNASSVIADSDFDGIPDAADPYVTDSSNNTGFWGGGTFLIAGQMVELPEARYNYSMGGMNWLDDQDMDGIPNMFDPYGSDPTNYTIGFGGGSYMVNGVMTDLSAGYVAGIYSDYDGDGIPDYFDPHSGDSTNNSSYWNGSQWWVDGTYQDFAGRYYATSDFVDADGDGLLDLWDLYDDDVTNNTSFWTGGTFTIDGESVSIYPTLGYNTQAGFADLDLDLIPDAADPYVRDAGNDIAAWRAWVLTLNPFDDTTQVGEELITTDEWFEYWFMQDWEMRSAQPPYLQATDLSDTDGDLIPDVAEDYFGLDSEDPLDALEDPSNTGWTNLERYMAGQDLNNPWDPLLDWNGDMIANVWKLHYGFGLFDPDVAMADPDEDSIVNLAEYMAGTNPLEADTGDFDADGLNLAQEIALGTDPQTSDTDGNGISDGDEDFDGDGLSNAAEYAAGTNPLDGDSDDDGWNDGEEQQHGGNPLDPNNQPQLGPISDYVTTQVRWVNSNWSETGGTIHHTIWDWDYDNGGGWRSIGGYDETAQRRETGSAIYSDGMISPEFSSFGESQGALGAVSSTEWTEGSAGSVSSAYYDSPASGHGGGPPTWIPEGYATDSTSYTTESQRNWNGGALEVRLAWKPGAPRQHVGAVTANYFTSRTTDDETEDPVPCAVTLNPSADFSTVGGTEGNGVVSVSANAAVPGQHIVQSIEEIVVLQPEVDPDTYVAGAMERVHEVRFSRWQDAFYSSFITPKPNFIDSEKDRFVITIPERLLPNTEDDTIHLPVATKRPQVAIHPEDTVEDGAHDVEFTRSNGVFVSKPMILVPDEEDDVWSEINPADEAVSDFTHHATPGGTVQVRLPTEATPTSIPIMPYRHKIVVETYVAYSPSMMPTSPYTLAPAIEEQISRAKRVFKQVHVQVEHHGPYACDIGDTLMTEILQDLGDGLNMLLVHEPNHTNLHSEGKKLFNKVLALSGGQARPNTMRIVFFPCAGINYSYNIMGQAVRNDVNNLLSGQAPFGNHEGFMVIRTDAAYNWRIAAHEMGHILGMKHRPSALLERAMLMNRRDDDESYGDSNGEFELKRFHQEDLPRVGKGPKSPFLQQP